ncbi:hypothetical protein [Salibacterium salarium]|uniref:hypothetical protein n=1 Tax=Salibacterium salarium TaxID=284579 RepID=UPI001FEBAB5B|nr:hypothetical protein [Salibacterium salarium]
MTITTEKGIRKTVEEAIDNQPITDIHTHLFSPNFGDILLWDIDELLTYHYLVAEVMRWTDMDAASFWRLNKKEQAELIWQKLFIERTPVSEAARGVLTTLQEMGIDPKTKNLDTYRAEFAGRTAEAQVQAVMEQANVSNIVMTMIRLMSRNVLFGWME